MKGAEKDAENLRHKQHMAKRVRALAAELAESNKQIDAMRSACKGYADTVLRVAGERDAQTRRVNDDRVAYETRIESMFVDLRERTRERDAALSEARKYAETRRLADDLRAELAAAKDDRAQNIETARQWKSEAMNAMLSAGYARAHAEILARLIVENKQGAHELAGIILAKSKKPCAT